MAPESGPLTGPVHVVGAGLLGTSVGLALTRAGITTYLSDLRPEHVRTAGGLGAGIPYEPGTPVQLVVVAVPPDHVAASVVAHLTGGDAVVTDVGSVKGRPRELVAAQVSPEVLARYVGSHPMAGSERSGPLAASGALFDGRPWAVTPHETSDPDAVALVTALAELCGGSAVLMSPAEHDRAVARTSHLPHLLAVLAAGRLADAPAEHLALSGQGVRDVTRIAGGDPALWTQIIEANGVVLTELLREVADDLARLTDAVDGARHQALTELLDRGVAGTMAIPGKHGGPAQPMQGVFVSVPDVPGELARLLADTGEIGVNVEDLHIDHDPGRPVGLVEVTVAADQATHLTRSLEARGWTTHG